MSEPTPPRRGRPLPRLIGWFLLLAAIGLAGLAFKEYLIYRVGNRTYNTISKAVILSTPVPHLPPPEVSISTSSVDAPPALVPTPQAPMAPLDSDPTLPPNPTATTQPDQLIVIDFPALHDINPDANYWIYSAGTPINYPMVYAKDNQHYLTHLIDGNYNKLGSLFIDARNASDFSDDNTLIYGHNMDDGSMFSSLLNYRNPSYFQEHPFIYILTPSVDYRAELLGGFELEPDEVGLLQFNFASSRDKQAFYLETKLRSSFESPVEVDVNDRFVSFLSCLANSAEVRYAVIARLVPLTP